MIKKFYPNIKTFMIIKCDDEIYEQVKRVIKKETVNTDFYFVNNFDNLVKIIKELIKIKL